MQFSDSFSKFAPESSISAPINAFDCCIQIVRANRTYLIDIIDYILLLSFINITNSSIFNNVSNHNIYFIIYFSKIISIYVLFHFKNVNFVFSQNYKK